MLFWLIQRKFLQFPVVERNGYASKVNHVDHHGDTYRDKQRKGVTKVLELKGETSISHATSWSICHQILTRMKNTEVPFTCILIAVSFTWSP